MCEVYLVFYNNYIAYEHFIGIYEKLQRLVRKAYMMYLYDTDINPKKVNWYSCSIEEIYPKEHALIWNISEVSESDCMVRSSESPLLSVCCLFA